MNEEKKNPGEDILDAVDSHEVGVVQDKLVVHFKNYFVYDTMAKVTRANSLAIMVLATFCGLLISRGHARMGVTIMMVYAILKLVFTLAFTWAARYEYRKLKETGDDMKELLEKLDKV